MVKGLNLRNKEGWVLQELSPNMRRHQNVSPLLPILNWPRKHTTKGDRDVHRPREIDRDIRGVDHLVDRHSGLRVAGLLEKEVESRGWKLLEEKVESPRLLGNPLHLMTMAFGSHALSLPLAFCLPLVSRF